MFGGDRDLFGGNTAASSPIAMPDAGPLDECDDPRFEGPGAAAPTSESSEMRDARDCRNISIDSRVQPSAAGPEQIDIHQSFHIGSIESDVPVTSANLTMDIKEIRSDLNRCYYRMVAEVQNAMTNNPPAVNNPIEEYAEQMGAILIQNSLVFNNLVEANVFDGDHSIELYIDWRGMPGVIDLDSIEPMQILDMFSFTFNLSLDEATIMRSPLAEMVDQYVQQGHLQIDGGRILMGASLGDADLTVNGETVELEQFL